MAMRLTTLLEKLYIAGSSNTDLWQRPDTQGVGVNLLTPNLA